jgi:hypothetical protein
MLIVDAADACCVYPLVNPLLARPFYVGARPPGRHTGLMGMPPRDREHCQKIMAAIREAGSRVQVAKVAFVPQEKALETEALWMGMLVRGAVDLVNHQVDEAMRLRALKAHLASCRQAAPASKGKRQPPVHPGQADLFGQAHSPSTTAPSLFPSVLADLPPPEDIDALPARNGLPWTDEEVRQLAAHFLSGESVDRLATRLQRTPAAILGKLAVIASTRREVKQRMLEIGLRRSGWARPLAGDEAMALRDVPSGAPNWMGNGPAPLE